jgi:hypothetical protein
MSRWRRHAMQAFPERRIWVRDTRSPQDVLWLLQADVHAATASGSHPLGDIVARAFDFATWCFAADQSQSVRDAAVWFYLHLAPIDAARRQLVDRVPLATWRELWPQVEQHLEPDVVGALRTELRPRFGAQWDRFVDSLPYER